MARQFGLRRQDSLCKLKQEGHVAARHAFNLRALQTQHDREALRELVVTERFIEHHAVFFKIIGQIRDEETIATGQGIRPEVRGRLRKKYGSGSWRKRKGIARVELENGDECEAEVHWYEAHGIGKKDFKIKCILD